MMSERKKTSFVPQLCIGSGVNNIDFYTKAFNADVLRQWTNEDGSIHVAELAIGDAVFHLHQESPDKNLVSPETNHATTVIIGLFVSDVDAVMKSAIAAGAIEISPAQ